MIIASVLPPLLSHFFLQNEQVPFFAKKCSVIFRKSLHNFFQPSLPLTRTFPKMANSSAKKAYVHLVFLPVVRSLRPYFFYAGFRHTHELMNLFHSFADLCFLQQTRPDKIKLYFRIKRCNTLFKGEPTLTSKLV